MKIATVLSLIVSISALSISLLNTPYHRITNTDISTFITVLAFCIGSYYALLAVRAYGHKKELEDLNLKISKISTRLEEQIVEYKTNFLEIERERQSEMIEFYDHQISLTYVNFSPMPMRQELEPIIEKRRSELFRQRSLMAFRSYHLDSFTRINRMKEITTYGYIDDKDFIQSCIDKEQCAEMKKVMIEYIVRLPQQ